MKRVLIRTGIQAVILLGINHLGFSQEIQWIAAIGMIILNTLDDQEQDRKEWERMPEILKHIVRDDR